MLKFLKKIFGSQSAKTLAGQDQAEEGLRQSEEQFAQLMAGVRDYAVILLDRKGNVLTWNAGAEHFKGYRAEEIIGQHFSRFYPPEAIDRGWPAHELSVASAEGRFEDEGWRVRKDGSRFWANIVITALRDQPGQVRGFLKITRDLTERKQAEENARRLLEEETARRVAEQDAQVIEGQREQLRVTLTSIGDAVITTNAEGLVTLLNPVAEALTGWTNEEAAHQPLATVFQIVNELTRQAVENPVARVIATGHIVGLANHTVLIAKDKTERAIDDSGAPIRNARGEVAGVVLVFRDISERRRQERTAQEALAQVRHALDFDEAIMRNMGEGLYTENAEGLVTRMNLAAERLFGWTFDELRGKKMHDVTHYKHPDGTPFPAEDCAGLQVLREGKTLTNYEDAFIRKDGTVFDVVYSSSPIRDGDRITGLVVVFRDVTERKKMEATLEDSELRFRRLFESAKDGILILDGDTGKITDANPFMSEMLGYAHDELLGKELWEIGLLKDKSQNEAAFRELKQNGIIRYDHLPLETRRGKAVEVEFVSNLYQVDHRPVAQCNIRDISDRSRLEKQMQEQAAALSDLHRRKDEFLAMLSHELRNPLAPISNAVQLLRLQRGSENLIEQQARNIIERQVGQLKHLVDDLLEVSRITTGRVQLRQERVAVTGIVERAVETVRPLIEQRRHELTVSVPPNPIWLYADAARLEQVVVNLLTNAAKYTGERGHIWLSVQQQDDSAVLRVRDTGVGIAPELLPRIFDLFTQAERLLDRSEGGLGIGLSLVQRLVELHGGRVEVSSVLGRGSEFVVRLPVTSLPPSPSPSTETAQPTTSLRVLVVDDNVDAAESLALLLRASRHDVRTAHDGPTALEAALDYRPDLVLLDIGLPELNGYEVAKRIRQQPMLKNTVLVAMTGYGQETDRQRSQKAGFDHHLVKPADFKNVQQILATVSAKAT